MNKLKRNAANYSKSFCVQTSSIFVALLAADVDETDYKDIGHLLRFYYLKHGKTLSWSV